MKIEEFKFYKSNGGIDYLYINHENEEYSTDYFYMNGGHRPCEKVQLKEIKRLIRYCEIMEYQKITG